MEHDRLSRLLPDGVDRSEAEELDATWRMLGTIEAPTADSSRMRARLDAVIDAAGQEEIHASQTSSIVRHITGRRRTLVLQGLAAAAMLLIGVAIGRFAASPSART